MEHMEHCAWCLLASLVFSKGLTNRRKGHPVHLVGNGQWWVGGDGGEGNSVSGTDGRQVIMAKVYDPGM